MQPFIGCSGGNRTDSSLDFSYLVSTYQFCLIYAKEYRRIFLKICTNFKISFHRWRDGGTMTSLLSLQTLRIHWTYRGHFKTSKYCTITEFLNRHGKRYKNKLQEKIFNIDLIFCFTTGNGDMVVCNETSLNNVGKIQIFFTRIELNYLNTIFWNKFLKLIIDSTLQMVFLQNNLYAGFFFKVAVT